MIGNAFVGFSRRVSCIVTTYRSLLPAFLIGSTMYRGGLGDPTFLPPPRPPFYNVLGRPAHELT